MTLNDDKGEDGNQAERVSERRDERSARRRTGIWQPLKLGRGWKEGGWIRRVKEEKVTCRENEVRERRSSKLQTIKAAAQLASENETFRTERV